MNKILLVDDSRTILIYISSVLKKRGYEIFTATSGEEALEVLSQQDGIQFVLSDWMMPGMNGIELCQTLKSHNFGRYIFFVLLSSKNDQQSIVSGIDAGADDFVDKKTSVEELEARIRAGFRTLELHNDLLEKNQELDQAYETIKRDLDSAGDLIKQILPKIKTFPCAELSYVSIPSAQIGGDMLGYMQLDPDHIAFYLIDVAGHGVSSALMSFSVQQSLSVLTGSASVVMRQGPRGSEIAAPEEVVEKLNQIYMSGETSVLYFTMIYAVLNTQTGLMSYCCAGHPPLVWYHGSNGQAELIGHDNFVVGAFDDVDYQSSIIQLEPGDKVWFYSDGITEADNGSEQFSEDGLRDTIEKLNRYPTQQQTEMAVRSVQEWRNKECFDDDVSVLVAEWKGFIEGENQCDMRLVKKETAQFFK
ncbi:putative response regulator [Vibrio ichthyoenteri ATCC 700023]|uniref:Putative response regulator n=1 Tax=Vibrio ichthyoenteri ATCC 700023 TaxID=870968 RepID=F9S767_9VIBR|nr:SpoIIE family protein phosphatase [Vibrio ichthyoenteri]EGU31954.1 putative response regulator [Vibrio ichthyoenteri ATCC 700023]